MRRAADIHRHGFHGTAFAVALALVAAPAIAEAAGPPRVGGEMEARFEGAVSPGKGAFEVDVIPETHRAAWLALDINYYCAKNGKRLRLRKPFIPDTAPRVDKSHVWSKTYRRGRWSESWKLKFSHDWTKVSGRFTSKWRSSIGESCYTGDKKFSGTRVYSRYTWEFGPYSGATSQGLAVSMTAAYDRESTNDEIRDFTASIRLACDDGTTREATVRAPVVGKEEFDGITVISRGEFSTSLNEDATWDPKRDQVYAALEGTIRGRTAQGTLDAEYSTSGPGDYELNCTSGPVSFTASR